MTSTLKLATFFLFFLSIVMTLLSIIYGSISWDATYYLPISRDISQGNVLYKDINCWYTPVMMYINAPIYYFFGNINYFWFLGFQYFITFLVSFTLFKIAKKNNVDSLTALFLSSLLYLSILLSEGIYINLEVYVFLCVLLAFYALQNNNFFLAGIFVMLSMFSKQYGVLNFIPFMSYIFFIRQQIVLKANVSFIIGSLLPIFVFIIYFIGYHHVNAFSILNQLSGEEYRELSISKKLNYWQITKDLKYAGALIFPILFFYKKKWGNKLNAILLLGFLLNLLPMFFQSYPHYFILTYPFLFLFLVFNYKSINDNYLRVNNICVLIAFSVVFYRVYSYKYQYPKQLSNAEKYEKIYPKNTTVFLQGNNRCLYLLNNYKNPILKSEGYSDIFEPDENFKKKYKTIIEN